MSRLCNEKIKKLQKSTIVLYFLQDSIIISREPVKAKMRIRKVMIQSTRSRMGHLIAGQETDMDEFDFDALGDKISDLIEDAVNSNNFQKLNETITDAVNTAIEEGADALKSAVQSVAGSSGNYKKYRYTPPKEFSAEQKKARKQQAKAPDPTKNLYGDPSSDQVKGIFSILGGAVLTGWNAIMLMVSGAVPWGSNLGVIANALIMAAGIGLIAWGAKLFGRAKRFKKYKKALGEHTYIDMKELTRVTNKPLKFVRKDVKSMIAKDWFREGHLDAAENTLITSNETYAQYVETEKQLQEKKIREARERAKEPVITPEVQEILDKGNEYLQEIRRCNEMIPGAEMTAKIKEIEDVVAEILRRAKEHPEITGDLKKLMNYYLPMTIKLLNAYAEMDRQPMQGENITKAKKEIEDTLETLHAAFVKLLDSLFGETALDVSTDISVLNTLLAQEGLKEDELQVAMRH